MTFYDCSSFHFYMNIILPSLYFDFFITDMTQFWSLCLVRYHDHDLDLWLETEQQLEYIIRPGYKQFELLYDFIFQQWRRYVATGWYLKRGRQFPTLSKVKIWRTQTSDACTFLGGRSVVGDNSRHKINAAATGVTWAWPGCMKRNDLGIALWHVASAIQPTRPRTN